MKLIKAVLWTALGVVIGITATLPTNRVKAQQKPVPERMVIISPAGVNPFGIAFVKDTKNGYCWIAVKENSNLSGLAVAPDSSCF